MARFSVYQQQTKPQPTAMTPQAAGAGVGQAMSQMGDTFSTIGANIQQRNDVLERVRLLNQFDQDSINNLETYRTTGDLTNPETLAQYQIDLDQRKNDLITQFKGSNSGREALRVSLENQTGQYNKLALTTQIEAQHKMLADTVQNSVNSLVAKITAAPDQTDNILAEFDTQISQLAPALYPDQERDFRTSGKGSLVAGAISGLLERGNYSVAKKMMGDETYNQFLNPDASRKFNIDIAVGEAKAAEAIQYQNAQVAKWSMLLKRDLSTEEIQRIKTMPAKKDMTVADEITMYELMTGKQAPQSVIDDLFNISADTAGTNTMTERQMKIVNEGAMRYSSGLMTPQEAQEYQMSVYELYAPKERADAFGNVYTTTPTMPPFVRESLNRGATTYGEVSFGKQQAPQAGAEMGQDIPDQGESLWDVAGFIPGPIAAAARAGFGTPFTEGLNIDPTYQRAAQRALNLREDIVAGIKPEGKIADQYRQELQALVTIEPKIWDNETALRTRMVEIDTDLRKKLVELRKITDGEALAGKQEKLDAASLSNNIIRALNGMNIFRPKTPDDYKAIPVGKWYVAPTTGSILQKKGD